LPLYGQYLKTGADGKLKIDKDKIAAEEKLDDKIPELEVENWIGLE